MATDIRRSRSNTSISTRSNRPLSRASTTSVHSFDHFAQQPQPPRASSFTHQPQYNAPFTTDALQPALLQAAQQVSAQDQLINMSLESVQQYLGYPSDAAPAPPQPNPLPVQPMDAHAYHNSLSQPSQPQHFMAPPLDPEERKKKGSASGAATNDKELRQLLNQNEGRNLKDVAAEVIQNDRTSKAEKSKQLFAMLWYAPPLHHPALLTSPGSNLSAASRRHPSPETESTQSMQSAVAPTASFPSTPPRSESWSASSSLASKRDALVFAESPSTTTST